MHVIFFAPNFPAEQREFVAALHRAGARVTAIGDVAPEQLDRTLWRSLHAYHAVGSLDDERALTELVQDIVARQPVSRIECTVEPYQLIAAKLRDLCDISGPSAAQVSLWHNNHALKQVARSRGVGCARTLAAETAAEIRSFVAEVGLPVLVVRAQDGGGLRAGSEQVFRADTGGQLEEVIRQLRLDAPERGRRPRVIVEEFYPGHEGFYDTLTVHGQVVFEAISHYYPNPLEALRTRDINPSIVTTNRVDSEGYQELRTFGRSVLRSVGAESGAHHLSWSFGGRGLWLSELRARPPGARFWELYGLANEIDLYQEWANVVVRGRAEPRPTRRYAAGLLSIRPNRDGRVIGYHGIDEARRRHGAAILHTHLPAIGQHTAELGAGYTAHGWMWLRLPDYDELRRVIDQISQMVHIVAG